MFLIAVGSRMVNYQVRRWLPVVGGEGLGEMLVKGCKISV
jgi:hypothetical protein